MESGGKAEWKSFCQQLRWAKNASESENPKKCAKEKKGGEKYALAIEVWVRVCV